LILLEVYSICSSQAQILSLLDELPKGFNYPMPPAIPEEEYLGILKPPPLGPFNEPAGPPIPEPDPYLYEPICGMLDPPLGCDPE